MIVVFRDGIGGPNMMTKAASYEVNHIIASINEYQQGYKPKIVYCLINRMSGHRLFAKSNGDVWNPGPGTLVDSSIVENQGDKEFDFVMIPHKATVATAMPVLFKVIYNTSGLEKKDIETFTYHLCYGYANWVGSIKVP